MKQLVGIIGGRAANTSRQAMAMAEAVGAEIGRRGLGIICGGDDGAIEAACRGCQSAGGVTIAASKWNNSRDVNGHVDYALATSMDLARDHVILWSASGVIAFEGGYGTASEIAVAMDIQKPLVVVGERFLLRDEALEKPWCRRIRSNDPSAAPRVVETLIELIATTPASWEQAAKERLGK